MSMQIHQGLNQRMDMKQVLAPRMIQSMEVLQLPIMALQERIQQELDDNPVLEVQDESEEAQAQKADDPDLEPPAPAAEDTRDPGASELVIEDDGQNELDFDRLDALSRDYGDAFEEEHRPSRNGLEEEGDRKHDAMQNMASRPQSIQDYLADQLGYLDLHEDRMRLVRHVIA